MLPLNISELQVEGAAFVESVEPCPPIAGGEGSVVTALFRTRQVDQIATVEVLGPNGQIETLSGTTIHPIWSVDRQDWIELGELQEGERLQAADGEAVVLSATVHQMTTPVYNIEVHGEHVYQVGKMGVLIHNSCIDDVLNESAQAIRNITSSMALKEHEAMEAGIKWLGSGYRQIGKANSGVFLSKDGLRRFRMDAGSLAGNHPPNVPHVHFEWFWNKFDKVVGGNNHVPIIP